MQAVLACRRGLCNYGCYEIHDHIVYDHWVPMFLAGAATAGSSTMFLGMFHRGDGLQLAALLILARGGHMIDRCCIMNRKTIGLGREQQLKPENED
jgi:hypothetical protein